MKIPKNIKIKGKTWKVLGIHSLKAPDGSFVMGLCDPSARAIYIDAALKGEALLSTFLHELNHAIMVEIHVVLDIQIEEVIVDGFADVYSSLFKFGIK